MANGAPLSDAWFDELAANLAGVVIGERGQGRVALGQLIEGDETLSYTIAFGDGQATAVTRGVEHAEVCLVEDRETALALLSGEQAGTLLFDGRIKVRGDVNALLAASDQLASLSAALEQAAGQV